MDERITRSRAQEKGVAERYRGGRTVGSGNGWRNKGDVRADKYLIECKRTDNAKGIRLTAVDLRKIEAEALLASRIPLLTFELAGRNYVVMLDDDFQALEAE